MTQNPVLYLALAVVGSVLAYFLGRMTVKPAALPQTEEEKQRLIEAARAEAEAVKRQAAIEAKELAQKARADVEADLRKRRADLDKAQAELTGRDQALDKRERDLKREADDIAQKEKSLTGREQAAESAARSAATQAAEAKARLEKIAGLSVAEAKAQLQDEIRDDARRAVAAEVKKLEDTARAEAEGKARMVLGAAVQRYASEYVAERTVAVVPLPSDDLKGRIIGREGRNIRALEAATGIDLIIDDTPEAVVISCFNPVRREIARLALGRLIADGRIHPTRIEEMVDKAQGEIEQQCRDAGSQAAFDLGLGRLQPELARLLGSLKFRTSGAQNLLQHSIEVGHLAGVIAGELGLQVKTARRAGLLHDIGRAADQEIEGSHAQAGAQLARKHGEPPHICRAIEAHEGEIAAENVLEHVVQAANLLSNERPGARIETMEGYIKRLHDLETVAAGFPGVDKAFAIQAGRELRVLVANDKVSDDEARILSRDIARRIEGSATYPGQVRVAVVRETRATDYAK